MLKIMFSRGDDSFLMNLTSRISNSVEFAYLFCVCESK